MLKKAAKVVFWTLASAVLAAALAVGGAVLWLQQGPKSIAFILPYMQDVLREQLPDAEITTQDVLLEWRGLEEGIVFRIKALKALDAASGFLVKLPEVLVDIGFGALLEGNLALEKITLVAPKIWLLRTEEGGITLALGEEGEDKQSGTAVAGLFAGLAQGKLPPQARHLQAVEIQDATLVLVDKLTGVYWKAPHLDALVQRNGDRVEGELALSVDFQGEQSALEASFVLPSAEAQGQAQVKVKNLRPEILAEISPKLAFVKALAAPLDGEAQAVFDARGKSEVTHYTLRAGAGSFTLPQHFPEPIQFSNAMVSGAVTEDLHVLQMESFAVQLENAAATGKGVIRRSEEGIGVELEATLEKPMPVDDLQRYWPLPFHEKSRGWVTGNIRGGMVTEASVALTLTPQDIENHGLPEHSLSADIKVEGASVDYHSPLFKAEGVNALIHFTGIGMVAQVSQAKMFEHSTLKKGTLTVTDFHVPLPRMTLALEVEGPASEIVRYANQPLFHIVERLNLDPAKVSGQVHGTVDLDVPLKEYENPEDGVRYVIHAEAKDAGLPELLGRFRLSESAFTLVLDNEHVAAKGSGVLNGAAADFEVEEYLDKKRPAHKRYYVKTTLTGGADSVLGKMDYPFFSGTAGLEAELKGEGKKENIAAVLQLDQAALDAAELGYQKPVGVPATLKMALTREDGHAARVHEFSLMGENVEIRGNGTFEEGTLKPLMLELGTARFGQNDLKLSLATEASRFVVKIDAQTLDIRPYLQQVHKDPDKKDPPMLLSLRAKSVLMEEGETLSNVTLHAECGQDYCSNARILGQLAGGKSLSLTMAQADQKRNLAISAGDAGRLIRGLGISQNVEGGTLTVNGVYNDAKPSHPLQGKLLVQNFSLKKSPMVARILSFASFSGVLDLLKVLEGKGIAFTKLSVPFVLENNTLSIWDSKASGDSLGFLLKGNIGLEDEKLIDIEGTFIPAYLFNINNFFGFGANIIGEIPLIGNVLTGGKGALFAAKFSVKGPFEQAQVSVNPLSMLAPGILREIFGSPGGGNAKKKENAEKQQIDREPLPSKAAP